VPNYYLYRHFDAEAIPWSPHDAVSDVTVHDQYFAGVFRSMEHYLSHDDVTIYLTWRVDELPSYGDDVVAVVLADEWCRMPRYANRVRAIFKCYGVTLPPPSLSKQRSFYRNTLSALQWLRTQAYRAPNQARVFLDRQLPRSSDAPIYDIPLGYANQDDLPLRAIEQRSTDIYFAGGFINPNEPWWSPRRWLKTPKQVSREHMVNALRSMDIALEAININLSLTQGPPSSHDAQMYSKSMMDTKICVVPRGSSLETFRFFESLRYGCITIHEELPDRWFYNEAPTIEVEKWSALEDIVPQLLSDPDLLRTKHERSLAWWRDVCSEAAVGRFMAQKLNNLTGPQ